MRMKKTMGIENIFQKLLHWRSGGQTSILEIVSHWGEMEGGVVPPSPILCINDVTNPFIPALGWPDANLWSSRYYPTIKNLLSIATLSLCTILNFNYFELLDV